MNLVSTRLSPGHARPMDHGTATGRWHLPPQRRKRAWIAVTPVGQLAGGLPL